MNFTGYNNLNIATIGNLGNINFYTNAATSTESVPKMSISAAGLVGIGMASPSYALDVYSTQQSIYAARLWTNQNQGLMLIGNSNVSSKYWAFGSDANNNFIVYNQGSTGCYITTGGTSWSGHSDQRIKKNIEPISDDALDIVSSLNPVKYHLRHQEDSERKSSGLIAQEVLRVLPDIVDCCKNEEFEDGLLGLRYTEIIPYLIKAIQQLRQEVKSKDSEISEIKNFLKKQFPSDFS